MPEFVRMIVVLFAACSISAGSLSIVNIVTKAPIAAWDAKQKEVALKEVFTDADSFAEMAMAADAMPKNAQVWEAQKGGQPVGHIFLIETQGYSGAIKIMFGTNADGAMTGMKVLSHTETPGLGAKITTAAFRDQYKNKTREQLALKKDQPGSGQIDAITAATISSRAVTGGIASALDAFSKSQGGK